VGSRRGRRPFRKGRGRPPPPKGAETFFSFSPQCACHPPHRGGTPRFFPGPTLFRGLPLSNATRGRLFRRTKPSQQLEAILVLTPPFQRIPSVLSPGQPSETPPLRSGCWPLLSPRGPLGRAFLNRRHKFTHCKISSSPHCSSPSFVGMIPKCPR